MDQPASRSPFLEEVRRAIRVRHYSIRTEEAYVGWIRRFILFHGKRHPRDMGEAEVGAFLSHLAVEGNVAAGTQNQALNALVFLYKAVLDRPLQEISGVVRAKTRQRLPVVLTPGEVREVLRVLDGRHWLVGCLLYGSGLRLMEAVRLRVKDIDFDHRAIVVRHGKGDKDRIVTFPDGLMNPMRRHLEHVRMLHEKDLADGFGGVICPSPWPGSIRVHLASGTGSTSFRPPAAASTPAPESYAGTTSTRAASRKLLRWRCAKRTSASPPHAIRCGTPSQHIFWNGGWTYARFRSS